MDAKQPLVFVTLRLLGIAKTFSVEEDVAEGRIRHVCNLLSAQQKAKLMYPKIKLWREIKRRRITTLLGRPIIPIQRLPEIEEEYQKCYELFKRARQSVYEDLEKNWPQIQKQLSKRLEEIVSEQTKKGKKNGKDEILKEFNEWLKPLTKSEWEKNVDFYYLTEPVPDLFINLDEHSRRVLAIAEEKMKEAMRLKEEAEKLRGSADVSQLEKRIIALQKDSLRYSQVAERLKRELEKAKQEYEERISELEKKYAEALERVQSQTAIEKKEKNIAKALNLAVSLKTLYTHSPEQSTINSDRLQTIEKHIEALSISKSQLADLKAKREQKPTPSLKPIKMKL